MKTNETNDLLDIGNDLTFTRIERRTSAAGTWVCGTVCGYEFCALVFPEHAEDREWEIGDSRISKLWVKNTATKKVVYNWDRGLDVPPADKAAATVVGFLCAGLADAIFAE
jgi:hypothetical protein